jgi:DNA-directed RNA polymerase subunit M/transcription elongation factor TFIIS
LKYTNLNRDSDRKYSISFNLETALRWRLKIMPSKSKSISCPRCSEKIKVPSSKDENIFINCESCGAKGRISNPYLGSEDEDKTKKRSDIIEEEGPDNLPEPDSEEPQNIDCPSCGSEITIPHSTKETVFVKCAECGAKGKVPNPYIEEREEEDYDSHGEIEIELIECPKCEDEIEVPFSEDERVVVECKACHAMGAINNPYLLRQQLELEEGSIAEGADTELEHPSAKGILEKINCPRCKETISVPFSTLETLKIECDSCGAKGKISNPYT